MAPELLRNKGYNCSCDIFSAGVIFYIMLTGRPLFKGSNPKSIIDKNTKCEIEFPEIYFNKISEEGLDLVKRMLAEDMDERITAKQALEHPWFSKDFQNLPVQYNTAQSPSFELQQKVLMKMKNPLIS